MLRIDSIALRVEMKEKSGGKQVLPRYTLLINLCRLQSVSFSTKKLFVDVHIYPLHLQHSVIYNYEILFTHMLVD